MMRPLVSVIIPCYNAEEFIADSVRSALEQDWPETEVIVVDDGSTDRTREVLEDFGDSIRWVTGPNRGACEARNQGLSMARGDYIQFLDSDDLLHSQKIRRSMEILEGLDNALVYSLHQVINLESDGPAPFQWNRLSGSEDPIEFMFSGDLPTPAPLHRRAILERMGGFQEGLSCAQDREFHMRLALKGVRFVLLPEILITIRRRKGSLGSMNRDDIERQRGKIAWDAYETLEQHGQLSDRYRSACAAMLTKAARGIIRSQPLEADELMSLARKAHPSRGIDKVYSRSTQLVLGLVGPRLTEELVFRARQVRAFFSVRKLSRPPTKKLGGDDIRTQTARLQRDD